LPVIAILKAVHPADAADTTTETVADATEKQK